VAFFHLPAASRPRHRAGGGPDEGSQSYLACLGIIQRDLANLCSCPIPDSPVAFYGGRSTSDWFWLLRIYGRGDWALWWEPDDFSVASSILPLCVFDDVVEPEPETGSQLLASRSHFGDDRIRFHRRSPEVPAGCK